MVLNLMLCITQRRLYVCFFNGKRVYKSDPPVLYLNGSPLAWSKEVKHLGNIITWDLSEEAEISYKISDFYGRVNSLSSNFKGINRNTATTIFRSQCCHFYGSQAWYLTSRCIIRKRFSTKNPILLQNMKNSHTKNHQ